MSDSRRLIPCCVPSSARASQSEQAALKVLYLAVRNLEEFRGPNTGIRSAGHETGAPGVHDLLRRTNPNPMKTATITYTDGRTLPGPASQGRCQGTRQADADSNGTGDRVASRL